MKIIYFALIVGLAGCAVGPNYKAPDTSVDAAFTHGKQPGLNTNNPAVFWWRSFNDDTMNRLVDSAIVTNTDLRIASANLREARALRRLAYFDLGPTITANGGYANQRRSAIANPPGVDRSGEFYDAGFDATWELDLFGRVRRSTEAARAQADSFEAARRDVLISVIAEVA